MIRRLNKMENLPLKWLIPLILAFSLSISLASAAHGGPHVVATTTILADVASRIGSPTIEVYPLVPADADSHAYEPTTDDIALVADADLLLTVGAGYEVFLGGLLENAGGDIPVVEVSAGVEILAYGGHEGEEHADAEMLGNDLECEAGHEEDGYAHEGEEHSHGSCDPHVWMNPRNVIVWANNLADAFAEIDPTNADTYRANADAYIVELEALDAELQEIVASVPQEQRILVTNHEFMSYFAQAYDFEVVATVLPASTTGAELDPQSLAALIELVRDEGVTAIFAEISANPQLAQVIADEAGVTVVTALYSDSLGGEDSPAPTYLDMMRYNAQTIVDALAG
jgi:zinc/manganese transport system substrate-binding protein